MTDERRDPVFGRTISELVSDLLLELNEDAIAFSVIVASGRGGFGLDGQDLVDFVRRCVTAMVEHGAEPVHGGADKGRWWIVQPQYGETKGEIIESVLAEWIESGRDPEPALLWFALPHIYE